ncbi:MAG: cytochrome C oxidase subunit IV family protein [Anaerolineae bacterium]
MEIKKASKLRLGWVVIGVLGVLTAVEYWIAVALYSAVLPLLAVIGLVKAGLIVQYFMHVTHLWQGGEGEH